MRHLQSKAFWQSVVIIAKQGLREQYKNSFLGIAWSLIQPTVNIIVMSLVFSLIWHMSAKDYFVYLSSGMLAWQFMVAALTRGAGAFCTRRGVFHHTVLPKSLFVFADIIVASYVFAVTVTVLVLMLLIFGKFHLLSIIYLPIALVPLMLFCIGGSFMLAYTSAYIWDIPHVMNIFFTVMFWACPIAYPITVIPESKRIFFENNPFYLLIHPIQQAIYTGELPSALSYSLAMGFALLTCAIGYAVFVRLRRNVIYYL